MNISKPLLNTGCSREGRPFLASSVMIAVEAGKHGSAGLSSGRGSWRRRAGLEAQASSQGLPIHDERNQRIAGAAAEVVVKLGVARLTQFHRRFRTVADLSRVAFEFIYLRISQPARILRS
jgi:hypothetical protein